MTDALKILPPASQANCEDLSKFLTFALSPVLKKVKPAELVGLPKERFLAFWQAERRQLTESLGLACREVFSSAQCLHLVFYNPALLAEKLAEPLCQTILRRNGYTRTEYLDALFAQLSLRLREGAFPHEIGLFLGYPPQDVEAFVRFAGKNFRLCRYWKVYHDVENSLRKFQAIDEAKRHAARLLRGGITVKEAISMLQAV